MATNTSSLTGLLNSVTGSDANFNITPGQAPPDVAMQPTQPGVQPVDMTASNAATFGAAKDQAGQTGRAQIDSMNGLLGAAGMLGGGAQAAGTRDVVEQAGQGVNDVTRQNAVTDAGQRLSVAQGNQSAGLTGRGQDIGVAQANQGAQLAERGQDISAQQAQAQLAMAQAQLNSQRQLGLLNAVLGFAGSGGSSTSGQVNGSSLY